MSATTQRLMRAVVGAVAGVSIAALTLTAWEGDDAESSPDTAGGSTTTAEVVATTTTSTAPTTTLATTTTAASTTTTPSTTTTLPAIVPECGNDTLVIEVLAIDAERVAEMLDAGQIDCVTRRNAGATTTSVPDTVVAGSTDSTSTVAQPESTTTSSTEPGSVEVVYFGAYTSQSVACDAWRTLTDSSIYATVKYWSDPGNRGVSCDVQLPSSPTGSGSSNPTTTTSSLESTPVTTAPEDTPS